jgi:hypothetical protein
LKLGIAGAALTVLTVTLPSNPAFAAAAAQSAPASAVKAQAEAKPPLVPADFAVPTSAEGTGFNLVPLGPSLAKIDFDAYMSSIEHLQKTFSRSPGWPTTDISSADAMKDMENEQGRFQSRKSFAYAVLTPDGTRERGSVYVSPSPVEGYDAVVRMWVTKADHDAGFDAELYGWVTRWVQAEWPFQKVAYPGRAIEWAAWDGMVAASKARAAAPKAANP